MTKLRQAMIDAMQVRGFSTRTHRSYLDAVGGLTNYYERSPAQISTEEIQRYFLYLVQERQLAPASCRLALNGIVFLYREVLHQAFEAENPYTEAAAAHPSATDAPGGRRHPGCLSQSQTPDVAHGLLRLWSARQ